MEALERARALSDRLVAARRQHRQAEHTLAVLLAEMDDGALHRALGYASIGEYAAVVLDLTQRHARDLLRLGRRLPDLPALDAVMAAGELDWTKAREVATVATSETEAAWVEHARRVPSRVLERDVATALLGDLPPDGSEPVRAPARRRLVLELEATDADVLLQAIAVARARADLDPGEAEDGVFVAEMARRYLQGLQAEDEATTDLPTAEPYRVVVEHCPTCHRTVAPETEVSDTVATEARCDAEVVDMRDGPTRGHATRTIPPAVRRAVLHRFGWRCAVPCCRHRLWLQLHHRRPFARGGGHEEANLVPLCSAHHRAVHDGVLALDDLPDGRLAASHADGRCVVEDRRSRAPEVPSASGTPEGPLGSKAPPRPTPPHVGRQADPSGTPAAGQNIWSNTM